MNVCGGRGNWLFNEMGRNSLPKSWKKVAIPRNGRVVVHFMKWAEITCLNRGKLPNSRNGQRGCPFCGFWEIFLPISWNGQFHHLGVTGILRISENVNRMWRTRLQFSAFVLAYNDGRIMGLTTHGTIFISFSLHFLFITSVSYFVHDHLIILYKMGYYRWWTHSLRKRSWWRLYSFSPIILPRSQYTSHANRIHVLGKKLVSDSNIQTTIRTFGAYSPKLSHVD